MTTGGRDMKNYRAARKRVTVSVGVERAKTLAQALKCHPGVLVFPGWIVPTEAAA